MKKTAFKLTPEQVQLKSKIIQIITEAFPGATVELEATPNKLGGFVIYDGFTGVPTWNRMHSLWQALDSHVTPEERRVIGGLMCVAPHELDTIRLIPAHAHVGDNVTR